MSRFEGYHTALAEPEYEGKPVQFWTDGKNIALAADLMNGLPPYLKIANVLYAEPPWKQGYDIFNRRAGLITGRTWEDWLHRFSMLMSGSDKPVCAMVGKQGLAHISPDDVLPIKLSAHNCDAFLALWNDVRVQGGSTDEAVIDLAQNYGAVGDLCCGFGRASRLIKQAGGTFIACDVNATCIGYIAEHADAW